LSPAAPPFMISTSAPMRSFSSEMPVLSRSWPSSPIAPSLSSTTRTVRAE
jgi:hypothetical protein